MKQTLFLAGLLSLVLLGGCVSQNPSDDIADDSMPVSAEHCAMMPEMPGCGKHASNSGNLHHMMDHADMVTSEFDFISLMIPHHQEAVDTSRIVNATTNNESLKKLTQDIVDAQNKEIAMMQGWLATWYSGQTYTGMPYMPMMRDTSSISVISTIEQMRLEDMIIHHQGAIDMAVKLLQIMDTQDPTIRVTAEGGAYRQSLREFANAIITTQGQEIEQMKEMLKAKA